MRPQLLARLESLVLDAMIEEQYSASRRLLRTKDVAMTDAPAIPAKMKEKYEAIWSLLEPFCREHLNEEYRAMCQQLLALLARKRPSPLVNGTSAAWACGIVRTVGWVNFLDDPAQKPHVKTTEIDEAFGVSSGAGQSKSKTIRAMLKIRRFDHEWTLPSMLDSNPMAWLVQVNGLLMDARHLPREIQQYAVARGLIPYLPEDTQEKPDRP